MLSGAVVKVYAGLDLTECNSLRFGLEILGLVLDMGDME